MSTTLKWGLITGMVYVIFSLVSNLMGIQESGSKMLGFGINTLMMLVTFYTIYLGVKESRDQDLNGYITMGQGFMIGVKIALIAGLISAVFLFIYTKFIDPEFFNRMLSMMEEQWDKAEMPEESRDMARKWTGYFMNPISSAIIAILYTAFWGLIKGVVAGAMLKKEAPPSTIAGV